MPALGLPPLNQLHHIADGHFIAEARRWPTALETALHKQVSGNGVEVTLGTLVTRDRFIKTALVVAVNSEVFSVGYYFPASRFPRILVAGDIDDANHKSANDEGEHDAERDNQSFGPTRHEEDLQDLQPRMNAEYLGRITKK